MDNINSYSTIEIPVNISETHFTKVSTPILHIDLSSNQLQQQLTIEQLLNENRKLQSTAYEYEQTVLSAYNDNNALSNELNYLQNNIITIDKQIEELTAKIRNQQQIKTHYETKVDTLNYKLQYLQSKKQLLQTQSTSSTSNDHHRNKSNYLSSKFNNDKYTEEYIIKCLSSDILDFNSYTKIEADTKMPIIITKIIPLLQDVISSLGYGEYKLRIFGSYATGLSLPSSELDLVIVGSSNKPIVNEHLLLQKLCGKLNEMKGFQCTFVEKYIWPFVMCNCGKEFNDIVVNISVQDNNCKHKGLQCIELIGRYVNIYPILEPVIIVIKQILKYGNVLNYYVSYI